MNVYHVHFSNPTLKEKSLALNNNLPPLLSRCFCLDIKHPHCTVLWLYGTQWKFCRKLEQEHYLDVGMVGAMKAEQML